MVKATKAFLDELCEFGAQVQQAVSRINPPRGLIVNPTLQNPGTAYIVVEKNSQYTYYRNDLTYKNITFQIGVAIGVTTPERELYVSFEPETVKYKFNKRSQFYEKYIEKEKDNKGIEKWFTIDSYETEFFKDATTDARKVEILVEILTAVCDELDKP